MDPIAILTARRDQAQCDVELFAKFDASVATAYGKGAITSAHLQGVVDRYNTLLDQLSGAATE